jgi:hypothetical protein
MTKLYVAGASKEIDIVEMHIKSLRASNIEITHDWCEVMRKTKGMELSKGNLRYYDLEGVDKADLVWVMVPKVDSIGCYVEMGYALALRKPLIVSGDILPNNIFALLGKHFETHQNALEHICFHYGNR